MGINSRKSLHPRWVDHNRAVIDGFKTCTVKIYRPNSSTTNPKYNFETGAWDNAKGTLVYEGPARIQPYGINLDLEVGLDPTARRLVLVQLQGRDLGIRNDDMLVVTETDGKHDDLLDYRFDIRGSLGSSVEWGTNLVCETNLKVK